jgi:hypothetical protein
MVGVVGLIIMYAGNKGEDAPKENYNIPLSLDSWVQFGCLLSGFWSGKLNDDSTGNSQV